MKSASDVKSTQLDVLAIQLHTTDLTELEGSLRQHTGQYREPDIVPFILGAQDFSHPESLNTGAVVSLFARYRIQILSLRYTNEIRAPYTAKLHLAFTLGNSIPAEPQPKAATPAPVQTPAADNPVVLVSAPVRTGQQIYAKNTGLIVTSAASQGVELVADDDIHVYAPMHGRALAGAGDNRNARAFIHSMQAELVSTTGIYRNFEQGLPDHLHKKPVQISLQDDHLVISAIDAEQNPFLVSKKEILWQRLL